MTPIKRLAGTAGAAVLLAFSLTACGGDAPDDASVEDFCDAYNGQFDAFSDIDPEASPGDQADALAEAIKDFADKLEEVGTPDDISDDAREGFEITVDKAGDIDADDIEKAIEEQNSEFIDVSEDDKKKADAFTEYATDKCGAEAPTE